MSQGGITYNNTLVQNFQVILAYFQNSFVYIKLVGRFVFLNISACILNCVFKIAVELQQNLDTGDF